MVLGTLLTSALLASAPGQTETSPRETASSSLADQLEGHLMQRVQIVLENGEEITGTLASFDEDAKHLVVMDDNLEDTVIETDLIARVTIFSDPPRPDTPNQDLGIPSEGPDVRERQRLAKARRREEVLDNERLSRQRAVNVGLMAGGGTLMATGTTMLIVSAATQQVHHDSRLTDASLDPTIDDTNTGGNFGLAVGGASTLGAGIVLLTVGAVRHRRLMRPRRDTQLTVAPTWHREGASLTLAGRF